MTKILLMSGGNDSLYIYNNFKHEDFDCIYFDYGQSYSEEEIKRIPDNSKIIKLNSLEIEENGYVRGRNLSFLIEIAKRYDEGEIWMGSNLDDIFPDNNEEYLQDAIKVVNISFNTKLKVYLPLKYVTKKEIMNFIKKNSIDSYSCYKGGDKPCGECKACLSIKDATHSS